MIRGIERGVDSLINQSVGLVFSALPTFVLDDLALIVEASLGHRRKKESHAVCLSPQCHFQSVRRHILEIVGSVRAGGPVDTRCTDSFEGLEVIHVMMLRALKHHVFEKMGEPGSAASLILRANVIPEVHRYDWR